MGLIVGAHLIVVSIFQLVDNDPALPGIYCLRKPLPLLTNGAILDLVVGKYGPWWWGEGGVPLDHQFLVHRRI